MAIASRLLVPQSLGLVLYLLIASAAIYLVFWLPATYLCAYKVALPLRRRNPLIGIYDDPACGHWLRPLNP